jgi:deoxyribodipyrimidine photo-lyase
VIDDLRVHAAGESGPDRQGEFVLYWMRGTTLRARSNFALNFAIEQANALSRPVLAYLGLRAGYRWANDRIHTFILQSIPDIAAGMAERGVQFAFAIETRDRSAAAMELTLLELARRSALIVTDWFPTYFHPAGLEWLRSRAAAPVIAVDATTLIPARYHKKEHLTARSIRPVLAQALPHHLFPIENPEARVRRPIELAFEPVEISARESIGALVARCPIDHEVPPSPVILGGSSKAAERLGHFLEKGLSRYADERGDPNVDATSRLSPHLHFGTIAVQDVLLAARAAGDPRNYTKFLDELVTWRELAHNLAYWNPAHRTLDAAPAWARKELDDHVLDPRPALYSDETLERGLTAEPLWNAAQRSLVEFGEIHNYVRMLWGKSVLLWTANAAEAFRILVQLNNKYALDGRDPNSYAGILWCFGRFDRPFFRRPIFGTVRYMSLEAAAEKFDAKRYVRQFLTDGES